jgi:hypothetical protein
MLLSYDYYSSCACNGPKISLNMVNGRSNEIITQKILDYKPCSLQLNVHNQ